MSLFNNREIATAIWAAVVIVYALSKRNVRKSILSALRAFFRVKIVVPIGFMILYTTGMVAGLYYVNLWTLSLLKDTIVWFCFTGIVVSFEFITSNRTEAVFRKIVYDNIKTVVVIEFLVNTYTFSLTAELLLIAITTMIGVLDAVARTDVKFHAVAKVTTGLQTMTGLVVLFLAAQNAVHDYANLHSAETMRSFLLAPALSILFSPFVYLLVLFAAYELLFVRLELGPEKDRALKRYARRRIIKHCRFSLRRLRGLLYVHGLHLMRIQKRGDVDEILGSNHQGLTVSY